MTSSHRRQQLGVRAAAVRELAQLWALVDVTDLAGTIGGFAQTGSRLVLSQRDASAALAAQYFAGFRQAEGVSGEALPRLARRLDEELVQRLLRGAALSGVVNGRRGGMTLAAAARNGLVKVAGQASSLVLGGGRETLLDSLSADRQALGWQRVTSVDPCHFCAMVASRGAVFKGEDTAGFEAHDHCGCSAEPYYPGSKVADRNEELRALWDEVTEGLSGADARAAFRRALAEGRVAGGLPGGLATGSTALDAARAALDRRPGRGMTTLTRAQREALRDYESTLFAAINGQLRRGQLGDLIRRRVDAIDEVMAGSPLRRDVLVHRGVADVNAVFGGRAGGSLAGAQWTEGGYLSTTADSGIARQFAAPGDDAGAVMRIRVPRGTGGVRISGPAGQSELMLQRGLRLRVTGDSGPGSRPRVLDVEVVP